MEGAVKRHRKNAANARNKGQLVGTQIAVFIGVIVLAGVLLLGSEAESSQEQQMAFQQIQTVILALTQISNTGGNPANVTPSDLKAMGVLPSSDFVTVNGKTVIKNPFGGELILEPASSVPAAASVLSP